MGISSLVDRFAAQVPLAECEARGLGVGDLRRLRPNPALANHQSQIIDHQS